MIKRIIKIFLLSVPIILLETSYAQAPKENLQLKIGESVSIYSEKAYKRSQGNSFEAVGNVVIVSKQSTIYAEKASLELATGKISIIGNVRVVGEDFNIYGQSIKANFKTDALEVLNSRIVTPDFNLIAAQLKKVSDGVYFAKGAKYTTCKDCEESWSVYGDEIELEINRYVYVKHALAKVKGVSLLYIPYLVLPIKNQRETGVLFPQLSSTNQEGITFSQPFFWAIAPDKDLTLTGSFMGRRGQGVDLEYRQVFNEKSFVNLNSRAVRDAIYVPGKTDRELSGEKYNRNFFALESHFKFDVDWNSHFEVSWSKDLDFVSDFNDFTNQYVQENTMGASGFIQKRTENTTISLEGEFRRNPMISSSLQFDDKFVQTLPSISISFTPRQLLVSELPMLKRIMLGAELEITRFYQGEPQSNEGIIKNATRAQLSPSLDWYLGSAGPVSFSTNYTLETEAYRLGVESESGFYKWAGIMTSQASVTSSKVFGAPSVDKVKRFREDEVDRDPLLIGSLPLIKDSDSLNFQYIKKNSYRHSQQFNLIHYFTTATSESGNQQFEEQIKSSDGWFDYEDARKEDLAFIGINDTRTRIPVLNTLEFQWNNTLVRKSYKNIDSSEFKYDKLAHLNISQGILVNPESAEELTRLHIDASYNIDKFSFFAKDYYFHDTSNHRLDLGIIKSFDRLSVRTSYNYNSIDNVNLKTLRVGAQALVFPTIGIAALNEYDINLEESIRSIFQIDYLPLNDCWMVGLNYKKDVVETRYSFNFAFNFSGDSLSAIRSDYLNYASIQ